MVVRYASGVPLLDSCDQQLTVKDWLELPESPDRFELHDGMLVMAPPPGGHHQGISAYLHEALLRYARKKGGMALASPIALTLDQLNGYQPDLVYLSHKSLDLWTEQGVDGAPDLVVEILSPSTRRYDLNSKLPTYLEHGVKEVWIVDSVTRTLTIHRAGEESVAAKFGDKIPSRIVKVKDGGLGSMKTPRKG